MHPFPTELGGFEMKMMILAFPNRCDLAGLCRKLMAVAADTPLVAVSHLDRVFGGR